jgi:hypothetical protein
VASRTPDDPRAIPPFWAPLRLSGIPPDAARERLFCVLPVVVDWSSHVAPSSEDRAAKVSPSGHDHGWLWQFGGQVADQCGVMPQAGHPAG